MLKRSILVLLALTVLTVNAQAQSNGAVNLIGQVQKAAAVRWWSYTPLNAESGTNTPAVQNGPLSFQMDMSDVAAGNNLTTYTGGTAQIVLRSNAPYTLSASVASAGFGAVAAGDLALSDVGFGVSGLANSGAKVFGDPATGTVVTAGFDDDPSAAPKDVDEEPIFSASLFDVGGGLQVLSGPRISNRGGINSPNNGLLVDTRYAVGPQFYTPVDPFAATVTYTLATP